MTQQIKPAQIIARIEALATEAKAKGFKSGWVSYQLKALCEAKRDHLIAYDRYGFDCYIGYLGCQFASGKENIESVREDLEAMYNQEIGSQEFFNNFK